MKTWQVIILCMFVVVGTISLILFTPVGVWLAPILVPIAMLIFPHIAPYIPTIVAFTTPIGNALSNNPFTGPIIGIVSSAIGGVLVKRAKSQAQQVKASFEQQVSDVNIAAINKTNALRSEYEQKLSTQADAITTSLKSQYEPRITTLQQQLTSSQAETQKAIAERNAIQQSSLSEIIVRCRTCRTDYLKWQTACPSCKTPQVAIA